MGNAGWMPNSDYPKGGKDVNGLEAISYYNGWAQAVAGALIVMSGLAILSLVISQLHKIISFFEKFGAPKTPPAETAAPTAPLPDFRDADTEKIGELSRPFVEKMGQAFQLQELYNTFRESDLPHPHLTIKTLRESGKLVPLGDGLFSWNG